MAAGYPGLNKVEVVDLASETTVCQDLPDFPLSGIQGSIGGLGLQNNPFLCIGNDCYTPTNTTWVPSPGLQSLFTVQFSTSSGFSNMIVTGGFGAEILTSSGWIKLPDLPVPLIWSCAVEISSNTHMVIGGINSSFQTVPSTYFFHRDSLVWENGPPLNTARSRHSCGLIKGKNNTVNVIVTGGWSVSGDANSILDSVEVLDAGSTTWRAGPKLPIKNLAAQLVQDQNGGIILIGGSPDATTASPTLIQLNSADPGSEWIVMKQQLKYPRAAFTAFLIPENITDCS